MAWIAATNVCLITYRLQRYQTCQKNVTEEVFTKIKSGGSEKYTPWPGSRIAPLKLVPSAMFCFYTDSVEAAWQDQPLYHTLPVLL